MASAKLLEILRKSTADDVLDEVRNVMMTRRNVLMYGCPDIASRSASLGPSCRRAADLHSAPAWENRSSSRDPIAQAAAAAARPCTFPPHLGTEGLRKETEMVRALG